jgi:hypothetical protein
VAEGRSLILALMPDRQPETARLREAAASTASMIYSLRRTRRTCFSFGPDATLPTRGKADRVTQESDPARDAAMEEAAQMIRKYAALPPDVATAFAEMLERIRRDAVRAKDTISVQQMAADNAVRSILRRQALAMEVIQRSLQPVILLPEFSGDDFSELESVVISLLPATTEEVEDVEGSVAQAIVTLKARDSSPASPVTSLVVLRSRAWPADRLSGGGDLPADDRAGDGR